MPLGLGQVAPPRVETVAADQESVRRGVLLQDRFDLGYGGCPVLRIRNHRQSLAMLVRAHSVQTLQHLIAFNHEGAISSLI